MKKLSLVLCALLLSACSHAEDPAACPMSGVIKGAGTYPVLASDAPHMAAADLAASATLAGLVKTCSYKANEVDVDLDLNFLAQRGAKGTNLQYQALPYFVAVLSPDDAILQRQAFSTSVDFDNAGAGTSSETHTIRIPLKDKSRVPAYKIAAGFRLTPEQAKYDKENNEN